ncbi:MAG: NAD-binding protein [Chloroflexi bacterium]|nr:NAD-binding protein [Chloroflexota bacterium]
MSTASGGSPAGAADRLRTGVVGLGVMGAAMARRLVAAGHPLAIGSASRGPVDELVTLGARACASDAEIARQSDVCIINVPATHDVERVLEGPDGVLAGAHPDLVVVAMGTYTPSSMPVFAAALAERGAAFLDAPVSGGDIGARDGTLSVMVGGDETVLDRVRPVFEVLGRTITHIGPVGAGQVAKACNQLVVGANIQAVAEACALARAVGVDAAAVLAAIAPGLGGSVVLDRYAERMLHGRFEAGARVSLHAKDAAIVMDLARDARLELPAFTATATAFAELERRGDGGLDHSALVTLLGPATADPGDA